jgi:hypothetical protein
MSEPLDPSSSASMSSAADSPARTSALPVEAQALMESAQGSGSTLTDSLASYDHASSSWKTSQLSLLEEWDESSVIWPRAGMTRNGIAYRRQPLAPLTAGTVSGSWPTPDAGAFNISEDLDNWRERRARTGNKQHTRRQTPLGVAVRIWPTPTARDWKDGSAKACANVPANGLLGRVVHQWPTPKLGGLCGGTGSKHMIESRSDLTAEEARSMVSGNGGSLNPTWVEWLMGYPLGWTDCGDSATRSSRRSRNGSRAASSKRK